MAVDMKTSKQILLDIDYIGGVSLFGFCVFLVTAFQEANTRYPWDSAVVIVLFSFSGLFLIGFICWQKCLSNAKTSIQAIFPRRMMKHRLFICTIFDSDSAEVPNHWRAFANSCGS
ncbi:hypothetical protein LOCC1_G004026 [Lachnellula occidentalis]|uniref:Uncharacterized protein n=1 Tax=Lachnellula occidentalis TaxID=215460 RepID=A0A8H8S2X8_9HELO|nr:hypothetical protein LOCC1_G004026 [Lachnellula occidentalis]